MVLVHRLAGQQPQLMRAPATLQVMVDGRARLSACTCKHGCACHVLCAFVCAFQHVCMHSGGRALRVCTGWRWHGSYLAVCVLCKASSFVLGEPVEYAARLPSCLQGTRLALYVRKG